MDERRDLVDREELRQAVRVVLADHFPMTPLYRVNRAADAVLAVPAIADALAATRTCERDMARLVEERDEAQEWADRLAACAGGPEVIGEHSNANNPWANALELLGGDGR